MGVNVSVVAVDAGNSKTDVALIGDDGTVLATARGGGFQPPLVGVDSAIDVLGSVLERAVAALPDRMGAEPPSAPCSFGHISACLANADLPVEEAELARALEARGWGTSVEVRNDTFAILRAGVDEPRGVAVVCGAGINCVGMVPDGRTARFPAIGRISGDWGGGAGLAEEALWFAARAEDGRGEPTELARALPGHFGLDSMYALIEALHRGAVPLTRRHELTPVLFATAAAGDPVAAALVERLAEEVVAMASVALTRLGLLEEEAPVLLGGSVLAARHPQLNDRIAELLAVRAPKAAVRVVSEPPVLGAALLGLDVTRAAPEVHRRLRAQYA
ncbi:ATPase [Streptomyces sp. SID8374]|uniref:BadF/BadG/BcrA/BcrD ATPase family protein n=1 Tax=Streptomyces sp. SID8374 TaxID=2690354 RepID=UPI00136A0A0F|nr:ATPase [Streptomyces sp. SID8374]